MTIEEYADLLAYRSNAPAEALETLAEYAEIAIFNICIATGEIQLNNTTTKLTGYKPGELPETRDTKKMLTFEDDRHIVAEAMGLLMSGQTNRYHIEYRMRRKDGTLVSVSEYMIVLERDGNGTPTRICGLAQDLTRLRWAEEEARRIERESKMFLRASDFSSIAGRNRMLHATNRAASIIVGGYHQEYDLVLRQALRVLAESIEADKAYIMRNTMTGDRLSFFPRAIWDKDAIFDWNSDTETIAYDDMYPGWKEEFNDQFSVRSLAKDLPAPMQELKPLSGVLSTMFVPLYLQGDFFGMIVFEDRTQGRIFTSDEADIMRAGALIIAASIARHETLQQLNKAKEAAISGTRAKSEFLSRISHEIRTPLNAIIGMATLARKNKDPENINYYLDMIDVSSKQLLELINDVLDISKIDAGKLEVMHEPFDFRMMLESVVKMIKVKVSEKHQHLFVVNNADLSRAVIGDSLGVSQILINLLNNASKFTPENGSIVLTISEKKTRDTEDPGCGPGCDPGSGSGEPGQSGDPGGPGSGGGGSGSGGITDSGADPGGANASEDGPQARSWLRVSVSDTGIGISKESHARLFQVFEQVDGSITRNYGGSGLGLSICKKLVNLMGGEIWVESTEGEGADFIFEIPVEWGETIDPDKPSETNRGDGNNREGSSDGKSEATDWSGFTILLAEDIEINREIVEGLLGETGVEIVVASNGREALSIFEGSPDRFNLILMDMQMPVMDGLSATKLIRALDVPNAGKIPILAMTANAFTEDINACLEAGMNAHIAKPINAEELLLTLAQYL